MQTHCLTQPDPTRPNQPNSWVKPTHDHVCAVVHKTPYIIRAVSTVVARNTVD